MAGRLKYKATPISLLSQYSPSPIRPSKEKARENVFIVSDYNMHRISPCIDNLDAAYQNKASLRLRGRNSGLTGAPLEAEIPKDHPERQDSGISYDGIHENPQCGVFLIHPRHKVDAILGKTNEEEYGVYDETEDEDAAGVRRGIFRIFLRTHDQTITRLRR